MNKPIVEKIQPIIHRALRDYRVSWVDPDGSGELVDFLSPDGETIERGIWEVESLADEIAIAVAGALPETSSSYTHLQNEIASLQDRFRRSR